MDDALLGANSSGGSSGDGAQPAAAGDSIASGESAALNDSTSTKSMAPAEAGISGAPGTSAGGSSKEPLPIPVERLDADPFPGTPLLPCAALLLAPSIACWPPPCPAPQLPAHPPTYPAPVAAALPAHASPPPHLLAPLLSSTNECRQGG